MHCTPSQEFDIMMISSRYQPWYQKMRSFWHQIDIRLKSQIDLKLISYSDIIVWDFFDINWISYFAIFFVKVLFKWILMHNNISHIVDNSFICKSIQQTCDWLNLNTLHIIYCPSWTNGSKLGELLKGPLFFCCISFERAQLAMGKCP